MKRWLDRNGIRYEVQKSTTGEEIIFVPSANAEKTIRYVRRFHTGMRVEWRANYTWIGIFTA